MEDLGKVLVDSSVDPLTNARVEALLPDLEKASADLAVH